MKTCNVNVLGFSVVIMRLSCRKHGGEMPATTTVNPENGERDS